MKPKVSKSWACGRCGGVYPHDLHGKKTAELCCTCPACGGENDRYQGKPFKWCSTCKNKSQLDIATKNLEDARRAMAEAKQTDERRKNR